MHIDPLYWQQKSVKRWLQLDQPRNLIVQVNKWQALGLGCRGWWTIEGPPKEAKIYPAWRKVVQAAIGHLVLTGNSQKPAEWRWPQEIFRRLGEWIPGARGAMMAGMGQIELDPSSLVEVFLDVLVEGYEKGEFEAGPHGFVIPGHGLVYTDDVLFAGRRLWASLFNQHGAPAPPPDTVSAALQERGWLKGESLESERGWWIPRLVWEHRLRSSSKAG
jgi:hypothetical protein